MPIITNQDVGIEVGDVDLIDTTYDATTDGLPVMNEVNNLTMPKIIKEQPRPKNIGKGTWDKGIAKELAKQSKFYSKANKVLEKLGYIGVGLDVFIGIYENRQAGTSWKRTASDAFVDLTISLFIFAVAVPIATVVAAVLGAVLGGLVGVVFGSGPGAVLGAALGSGISIAIISILVASGLNYLFNKWDGYKGKTISEHMKEALWSDINWLEEFFNGLISCCD